MKQKKIISLPTNEEKIYKQILAFFGFMLNITAQERDILAELIKLDNEYDMIPIEKRGKFILSTDMRKEIQQKLNIKEKQFNVLISKLKNDPKKYFLGKPLIDENNIIHPELKWKPDSEGFSIEINFVMTALPKVKEKVEEPIVQEEDQNSSITTTAPTPPTEYIHDASKAEVIEEEKFDFTLTPPSE